TSSTAASSRASRRSPRVSRAASMTSGSACLAVASGMVTFCHHDGDNVSPGRSPPGGGPMTYAGDRVILDADSHVMELADFLDPHIDPAERDRLRRGAMDTFAPLLERAMAGAAVRRADTAAAAA